MDRKREECDEDGKEKRWRREGEKMSITRSKTGRKSERERDREKVVAIKSRRERDKTKERERRD